MISLRPAGQALPLASHRLPVQRTPGHTAPSQELSQDSYHRSSLLQPEWKPTARSVSTEAPAPLLKRLRNSGVRLALQVAMTASFASSLLAPLTSSAQELSPDLSKDVTIASEDGQNVRLACDYLVTAEDFVAQPIDTVKQKSVQRHHEKIEDSTDVGKDEHKSTLLGYELDTKFAKVSASPSYKDGQLKTKVKASAVRFSAKKEWTKEDGTQVRRGFSTRVNYEGEATYSADQGFGFQSKHLDTEVGLEQRYDKTIANNVQFSHRYFVGARHRYRFGEQEGSEVRAFVQTEQKAYKTDAFRVLNQSVGWEVGAKQTFVTQWGGVDKNGGEGVLEVEGLLTKTVQVKLLGKQREFRLKAGPEFKYSTREGFSVRPEVGVKVKL